MATIRSTPRSNRFASNATIGETLKSARNLVRNCGASSAHYSVAPMSLETAIVLIEENDADAQALQSSLVGHGVATRIHRLTCPSDAKAHLARVDKIPSA